MAALALGPDLTWTAPRSRDAHPTSLQIRVRRWEYIHYRVCLGSTTNHSRNGTTRQTIHVRASGSVLRFGKGVKNVRENVKRGGRIKLVIVPTRTVAKKLKK